MLPNKKIMNHFFLLDDNEVSIFYTDKKLNCLQKFKTK